jgi:putative nucleotidyltransferase with HDIG domain
MPTREDAWALLCEYTASESLRKHALAVEACVRAYAHQNAADEELWGITALLHDFDYERWPNQEHHPAEGHPSSGVPLLREAGYPEEMIHAILAHAHYTGVARETPLDHVLFACDEMAGFLTACSLVKPGKTIFEVEADSVKRKMKDKAFARGVSREDLVLGAKELGVPIEEHMAFCIAAMRGVADQLGLERKAGA